MIVDDKPHVLKFKPNEKLFAIRATWHKISKLYQYLSQITQEVQMLIDNT